MPEIKVGKYSHTILVFICPHCKKECFVNNGDETDLTRPDESEHTCEHCGKAFVLDTDDMEGF